MGYRVTIARSDDGGFVARNERGSELVFGDAVKDAFNPVELLLVALGGCNIVTVEPLTAQRGHRLVRLGMVVESEKVKPNRLGQITVTYDVELPPDDPDAARVFHDVARRVHKRHCTVSTALHDPTPVEIRIP